MARIQNHRQLYPMHGKAPGPPAWVDSRQHSSRAARALGMQDAAEAVEAKKGTSCSQHFTALGVTSTRHAGLGFSVNLEDKSTVVTPKLQSYQSALFPF